MGGEIGWKRVLTPLSSPMDCIESHCRPSWQEVFDRGIYTDAAIYSPLLHLMSSGPMAIPYEPDG